MRRTLLVAGMLVLAACGNDSGASQVQERTFLSTAVTENGAPKTLVSGTRLRMTFEDGTLKANAGCNHLQGQASLADGKLTVSDMGSTAIGCDPETGRQDAWFSKFLGASPAWRLDGEDLVLTTADTELRLTDSKTADPDQPLTGTQWKVSSLIEGQSVSSVPGGGQAQVVFGEGDRVEGETGCNRFSGSAVRSGQQITFSSITVTEVACPDELRPLETAVLAVLDGAVEFEIEAGRLVLTHPGGKGLELRA